MSMIHDITSVTPRNKRNKRKGRGESSGHGKTSGRGTKGAKARVGKYVKRGHEHGQTPIFRRLPKRGFSNENFEHRYHVVNLSDLERFDDGATVDATALIDAGLVPDARLPVKILGDGTLSKKLNVTAGWYSKSAHEKITGAGGTAKNTKGEDFKFPKPTPRFDHKNQGKKGKKAVEGAPAEGAAPAASAPAPAAAPAEGQA
jgi:large subunit ribosomal protein L15